jgi:hypothetical protein
MYPRVAALTAILTQGLPGLRSSSVNRFLVQLEGNVLSAQRLFEHSNLIIVVINE